jgi:hypothetical protein
LATWPATFHRDLVLVAAGFNVPVVKGRDLVLVVAAFSGPAAVRAHDLALAAVVFNGQRDPARAAALSDPESTTARADRRVLAKAAAARKDPGCGLAAMTGHLALAKAAAERNVPGCGLTDGQTAIGSPTVAPMATDSPTNVPAKAEVENAGTATTGATGLPTIGPIEFRIATGGTIGAAIVTTTAGNTGTRTGAIMTTGSTTIGG